MRPIPRGFATLAACAALSVFGIFSSLKSQVHGSVVRTTDTRPEVIARVRQGWYGYDPLAALKRAFQVTSTFTQYGTAELSSLTEAFLTELPRIEVADLKRRQTHLVVMDTVARIDGPGQFDLTH